MLGRLEVQNWFKNLLSFWNLATSMIRSDWTSLLGKKSSTNDEELSSANKAAAIGYLLDY